MQKMKAEKKQEWEESFKKAKKKVQDTDWEDKTRRTAGKYLFMGCKNSQTQLWQRWDQLFKIQKWTCLT